MRVRRQPYPADCPFAQGISWKWSAYFNQMQFYDVATSNYIEEAFQQKSRTVNLRRSPLRIPNTIHFSTMEQVNRRTKYSRKVQREETKEKYPLANHETTNLSGQHGSMVHNPVLPSLNGSVTAYGSHIAAVPSSTQIHYPIMASGSNNMTHAQSNLGNPSCRFSRPRSGLSTSTVTTNSNTGIQLTSNPAFQNMSTVGTSTMTNINTSSLSMPKRSPLYHLPPSYSPYSPSYAPSNYGASGTNGMSQASRSVPVASTTRKSRKQASRATTTQRQTREDRYIFIFNKRFPLKARGAGRVASTLSSTRLCPHLCPGLPICHHLRQWRRQGIQVGGGGISRLRRELSRGVRGHAPPGKF